MPQSTAAGVFGIARTTGTWSLLAACGRGELLLDEACRHRGRNGDNQRVGANFGSDLLQHFRNGLRFYCQQNDVSAFYRFAIVGGHCNAQLLRERGRPLRMLYRRNDSDWTQTVPASDRRAAGYHPVCRHRVPPVFCRKVSVTWKKSSTCVSLVIRGTRKPGGSRYSKIAPSRHHTRRGRARGNRRLPSNARSSNCRHARRLRSAA